jgi:hypothetical protein
MIEETLEEKIHRTDRKLKELLLHMQRLSHKHQEFLDRLALSPEQLKNFVENPASFSPATWEHLQNEKKNWEEQLNLELSHVRDANKTKKTLSERGQVQQHWLFVR